MVQLVGNPTLQHALAMVYGYESTGYKKVLEFGVFKGISINLMRHILGPQYEIFGFDSFEGLPEDWDGTTCKKGEFSTNGIIPEIENVTFFKGWFDDTLPEYLYVHGYDPIALLHVDGDLYSSSNTVLYGLNDAIKAGTVIVFDEWTWIDNITGEIRTDGEQKSFYEWSEHYNRKYSIIPSYETHRKIVLITE